MSSIIRTVDAAILVETDRNGAKIGTGVCQVVLLPKKVVYKM